MRGENVKEELCCHQGLPVLALVFLALAFYAFFLRRRLGNARSFTSKNLFYRVEVLTQSRRAAQMGGGVAFIGDSMIAGLATSRFSFRSENFGIGGETIEALEKRLPSYDLTKADAIVVLIGINNFRQDGLRDFGEKYRRLLGKLPQGRTVLAVALLPLNPRAKAYHAQGAPQAIAQANREIEHVCRSCKGCVFLNPSRALENSRGELRDEYAEKDGLHLSGEGYAVLGDEIGKALGALLRRI